MKYVWLVYTDENMVMGVFANKRSADAYVEQELEAEPRGGLEAVKTVVNDWSKDFIDE